MKDVHTLGRKSYARLREEEVTYIFVNFYWLSVVYIFFHSSIMYYNLFSMWGQREKRPNGEEPTRDEVYILTHTHKDGKPVNEEAAAKIVRFIYFLK